MGVKWTFQRNRERSRQGVDHQRTSPCSLVSQPFDVGKSLGLMLSTPSHTRSLVGMFSSTDTLDLTRTCHMPGAGACEDDVAVFWDEYARPRSFRAVPSAKHEANELHREPPSAVDTMESREVAVRCVLRYCRRDHNVLDYVIRMSNVCFCSRNPYHSELKISSIRWSSFQVNSANRATLPSLVTKYTTGLPRKESKIFILCLYL